MELMAKRLKLRDILKFHKQLAAEILSCEDSLELAKWAERISKHSRYCIKRTLNANSLIILKLSGLTKRQRIKLLEARLNKQPRRIGNQAEVSLL